MSAFAERLREARLALGLRQEDMAAHAGVGRTQIVNIEAGRSGITLGALERLCRGCEISADYLLGLPVAPDLERAYRNAAAAQRQVHFIRGALRLALEELDGEWGGEPPTDDRTPADHAAEEEHHRRALAAQSYADHIAREANARDGEETEPAAPIPIGMGREII